MRTPDENHRHRAAPLATSFAGALAAVAMLAACGGGGSSPAGTSTSPTGQAPEEFGLSLSELSTRIEKTESMIADCMTAAGFQYIALDFVSIKEAMDSDQTAPGLSSDDFIAQFGLGITTQFDQPIVTFGAGPQNAAYLAGLAASDQVAFQRALWGDSTEWNHAHALEAEDFSQTGGCTRTAAEANYSPDEITTAYVNPADVLIAQDPRMLAAINDWSGCMAADGYQYDNPDQVDDDLHARLDAIVQGQDPTTLTGPTLDALHDLQGEELAIAAVLTSCEEEHIEPVQANIESELYGAPLP